MRILIVKLTSMGDTIHLLPALSDLQSNVPDLQLDWMIEEGFADVPTWHNVVGTVIPIATRRWRSLKWLNLKEFISFWHRLRTVEYDVVIDAQGLIKSAIFARIAKTRKGGRRIGFSSASIKEKPAAYLYSETVDVAPTQHAISRLRELFAKAFSYKEISSGNSPDYQQAQHVKSADEKTVLFLHGTTWSSKHLPETHWQELMKLASNHGFKVLLPWGNENEHERAKRLATNHANAQVLEKSSLTTLKNLFMTCTGAIAVDTGLSHLAASIGLPMVTIYGATNAQLTGAIGTNQLHLQTQFVCSPCLLKACDKIKQTEQIPPCYASMNTEAIWRAFTDLVI